MKLTTALLLVFVGCSFPPDSPTEPIPMPRTVTSADWLGTWIAVDPHWGLIDTLIISDPLIAIADTTPRYSSNALITFTSQWQHDLWPVPVRLSRGGDVISLILQFDSWNVEMPLRLVGDSLVGKKYLSERVLYHWNEPDTRDIVFKRP